MRALLGNRGVIDHQNSIAAADEPIRLNKQFCLYRCRIPDPGGCCDRDCRCCGRRLLSGRAVRREGSRRHPGGGTLRRHPCQSSLARVPPPGDTAFAGILVLAMFRLAAGGRPLHHEFADRAAAVDGEMVDVVGNMPLVWSFCGIGREHSRLDATIDRETAARRRSLLYLEKLRLFHAAVTVVLIIALLAWAIVLWQKGAATAGDVVLVCTLGLSILHATRDLAVALVDVTQHLPRLPEALPTLLFPHPPPHHPHSTS